MADASHISSELLKFSTQEKFRAYARFLGIIWRDNPWLATFRFTVLLMGASLQPLEVYFFALFITAIASGNIERAPFLIGVVIASYGLRHIVAEITYSRIEDWFSRGAGLATERAIYEHVAKLDPEALNQPEIRRSLDFVREDLWRLNRLADRSEQLVRSAFQFIGTLALALAAPWWVTLVALADAALQAANLYLESKKEVWASTWNSLEGRRLEYTRYLFLNTEEFRELRLLGAERTLLAKRERAHHNVLDRFRDMAMMSVRNRTLLAILHVGAYAVVIIVLGRAAFAGPTALTALYVALNLFSLMGNALNGISSSITALWADMGILAYMNKLLSFVPERLTGQNIPHEPLVITFDRVSYRYPNAKKDAVSNLSFVLKEGEHLGVVGENGAGKSTFLRLLSGLIQPTKDKILLNGQPLSAFKPQAWRQAFHLMLQDAKLYQDFVRDNLMYGAPSNKLSFGMPPSQSANIAGADVVIQSLPQKERTFLGN
jgi:ABC-type multidrug transport system fused ATPase/permease subunit